MDRVNKSSLWCGIKEEKIDEIIKYLQEQQLKGYKTLELIDDARVLGWYSEENNISIINSKTEPTVLGIDIRESTRK